MQGSKFFILKKLNELVVIFGQLDIYKFLLLITFLQTNIKTMSSKIFEMQNLQHLNMKQDLE